MVEKKYIEAQNFTYGDEFEGFLQSFHLKKNLSFMSAENINHAIKFVQG